MFGLSVVGQQERFPRAKQVPTLGRREGEKQERTFDIRGWGCICELEVDAGVPTGEDLLLRVERAVFFFLRT